MTYVEKHLNITGVLWILSGSLGLIFTLYGYWILFLISFLLNIGTEASIILSTVTTGFSLFLAILSIPQIIGGIWLIKRKEWARILVLSLAFLNLINFPLGTALGIYSILILLKEETVRLFKSI